MRPDSLAHTGLRKPSPMAATRFCMVVPVGSSTGNTAAPALPEAPAPPESIRAAGREWAGSAYLLTAGSTGPSGCWSIDARTQARWEFAFHVRGSRGCQRCGTAGQRPPQSGSRTLSGSTPPRRVSAAFCAARRAKPVGHLSHTRLSTSDSIQARRVAPAVQRLRERIIKANFVVADVSGANPNVYLEIGFAWGRGPSAFAASTAARPGGSIRPCAPAGPRGRCCAVTRSCGARCTRRRSTSIRKNTYSRVSPIVSTVRKSQASVPAACMRRNSVQLGPPRRGAGPRRCDRRMVRTDVADTLTPSLRHPRTAATVTAGSRRASVDGGKCVRPECHLHGSLRRRKVLPWRLIRATTSSSP
jgi:hypothetical protein